MSRNRPSQRRCSSFWTGKAWSLQNFWLQENKKTGLWNRFFRNALQSSKTAPQQDFSSCSPEKNRRRRVSTMVFLSGIQTRLKVLPIIRICFWSAEARIFQGSGASPLTPTGRPDSIWREKGRMTLSILSMNRGEREENTRMRRQRIWATGRFPFRWKRVQRALMK